MDIFFQDPTDIPLPPKEVRIRQFRAEPWPDGRRVRVTLELTPFLKRPNGEIKISDAQGEEAASVSIIETMEPKMEFTMHLRGRQLQGPYTAAVQVFYLEEPEEAGDTDRVGETGRAGENLEPEPSPEAGLEERQQIVVDRAEATFDVPGEDEGR